MIYRGTMFTPTEGERYIYLSPGTNGIEENRPSPLHKLHKPLNDNMVDEQDEQGPMVVARRS